MVCILLKNSRSLMNPDVEYLMAIISQPFGPLKPFIKQALPVACVPRAYANWKTTQMAIQLYHLKLFSKKKKKNLATKLVVAQSYNLTQ